MTRRLALVLIAATIAAAGCSAPASRPATDPAPPARMDTPMLRNLDDAAMRHLLARATFGPRPGEIERVRSLGATAWLERELTPTRASDPAVDVTLAPMKTLTLSIPELLREFPRPDPAMRAKLQSGAMSRQELMTRYPPEKRPGRILAELQAAKMVRAVMAERQLEEVMVDFWFNHFNVFAPKNDTRWFVTAYERDVIRPLALGRFRDLVRASSRHPAMLYYLDNWLSVREDFTVPMGPNRGRRAGLNENYARELLELHTLGVDGGYTQKDVTEVARAFTGFTIDRPREEGRFLFRPARHDRGAKTVLGTRIPAGGGESDGDRVIDIVTRHPATARFIATKLVRRFVADDPPPALVERVAATFRASDGDIPGMLRTIFTAPEFWAPDARRAKIKKPFEFVASAARAVNARVDARGGFALARAAAEIGEPLYEAPPPTGHPDRAEAWLSTGALLARMNFALGLAQNRYAGVHVDLTSFRRDGGPRPADELALFLGSPEFQRR